MKVFRNFIFSPISDFCKHISNATIYLLVFIDVLLLITSASFSVWGKSLSNVWVALKIVPEPIFIIVGVFGGFVSGFILAKLLPELSNVHNDKVRDLKKIIDENENKLKENNDAIRALEEDKHGLEAKLKEKEAEINRLNHQSIDITSFKEVMQIVFAEAEMRIKDVKCEWLKHTFKAKTSLHRPKCNRFVCALEKEFTAKIGVDLKNIKIRIANKKLYVSGIVPKVDVVNPKKTDWLIQEVQICKLKEIGQKVSSECITIEGDDGRIARYEQDKEDYSLEISIDPRDIDAAKDQYDSELQERITKTNFEGYNMVLNYVKHAAESFIRMLLKPCENAGYTIEFKDEETISAINPLQLEDFVNNFNEGRVIGSVSDCARR